MNTITIEQMVEIPADHRLFIEVPPEVPAGRAIFTLTAAPAERTVLAFTPAGVETPGGESVASARKRWFQMSPEERAVWEARDMEIINRNAERLNREMSDALLDQIDL